MALRSPKGRVKAAGSTDSSFASIAGSPLSERDFAHDFLGVDRASRPNARADAIIQRVEVVNGVNCFTTAYHIRSMRRTVMLLKWFRVVHGASAKR